MPATSGVDFVVQVANERQTISLSGGSGTDTYTLSFDGATTGTITEGDSAASIQTELEGLSTIGAGNVSVSGSDPSYTVDFQGDLAGQDVPLLKSGSEIGSLTVTIAEDTPQNWTTVGGGRGATLNRSTTTGDATSKDSNAWSEEIPVIREWSIDFDGLLLEGDSALTAVENAFINNYKLNVRVQTPAGNTYTGSATLSDFNFEGPHDDIAMANGTFASAGALTKA